MAVASREGAGTGAGPKGSVAAPSAGEPGDLGKRVQTTPETLPGAGASAPPGQHGSSGRPPLQVLTAAECYDLISPGGVGRVAFTTAEGPIVLPVNYAMSGQTVIFRTAPDTLLAGYLNGPAGFEVDRLDEALSQGWSVLVTGRAVRVTSEAEVRQLEQHADIRPWAGGARDVYVRIIPRKITGRRISR